MADTVSGTLRQLHYSLIVVGTTGRVVSTGVSLEKNRGTEVSRGR